MNPTRQNSDQHDRDGFDIVKDIVNLEPDSEGPQSADELLDEALQETFPASDPIASGRFD